MKVGSLFAGIGGADVAVHAVISNAETVWQSDLVGEAVRSRHFPSAAQLVGDVRALDPARLTRVDLLTAGFPCQDLSVAGAQAGLDGPRSRLYREVLRFCGARPAELYADDPTDDKPPGAWSVVYGGGYQPPQVLIENVPALLRLIPRLSTDFRALGYGLTWTVCEAADAGHPHLRRRVFVLAELDTHGRGAVDVAAGQRWQPEGLRAWPTPTVCGNHNREGASPTSGDGLATAVRPWATPRASDADRGSDPPRAHGGTGGIVGQVRLWATPTASNPNETEDPAAWEARRVLAAVKHGTNGIGEPLGQQARGGLFGRRLSPAWVEALMGYPIGWTEPEGDRIPYTPPPPVRGRYPEGWDRSTPWPGFAWEPARTIPDGAPVKGRTARLRALGNAWCPAQGALALRALLGERGQIALF